MNSKIPDALVRLLGAFDAHEEFMKREEAARLRLAAEERTRLDEQRRQRAGELHDYAIGVFRWRDAFLASEAADALWHRIGVKTQLPIFEGSYYNGKHADACLKAAAVLIDGWLPRPLRAQLVYVGPSSKDPDRTPVKISDPDELVNVVEPDYLKALYEHLKGENAWRLLITEVARQKQKLGIHF